MTTEELVQKKKEILDDFDFKKVHDYMLENKWEWFHSDATMRVPSIETMITTAEKMLDTVIYAENPASNAGTGGWGIELAFHLTRKSSF